MVPRPPRALVAVPAFGQPHLTDAVLSDLLDAPPERVDVRVVVVDNAGDYEPPAPHELLSVHRPGRNLRWLGAANWALGQSTSRGDDLCLVLNNDTRLSAGLVDAVALTFEDCADVALAAPCYDDFWVHQRADPVPATAGDFVPRRAYREVPFCDGTAIAFRVPAVARLGLLDGEAFPRHGYGADIDWALRAREAGMRCVVTENAFVHHLRRGTMDQVPDGASEGNRAEILTGMDAVWGAGWRERAGLGDGAFPPHNTGSAASWYGAGPWGRTA